MGYFCIYNREGAVWSRSITVAKFRPSRMADAERKRGILVMKEVDPKVRSLEASARPTWHGTPPLRAERVVKASVRLNRCNGAMLRKMVHGVARLWIVAV